MYNVKITPQYYSGTLGNRTYTSLANDDGQILCFETDQEAKEWIDESESNLSDSRGVYVLSHGEYARPVFEIVEAGKFEELEVDDEVFDRFDFKKIELSEIPEKIRSIIEDGNCGVEDEEYYDDYVIFSHDEEDGETGDTYRVAFFIDKCEVDYCMDDFGNIGWDRPKYFVQRSE